MLSVGWIIMTGFYMFPNKWCIVDISLLYHWQLRCDFCNECLNGSVPGYRHIKLNRIKVAIRLLQRSTEKQNGALHSISIPLMICLIRKFHVDDIERISGALLIEIHMPSSISALYLSVIAFGQIDNFFVLSDERRRRLSSLFVLLLLTTGSVVCKIFFLQLTRPIFHKQPIFLFNLTLTSYVKGRRFDRR